MYGRPALSAATLLASTSRPMTLNPEPTRACTRGKPTYPRPIVATIAVRSRYRAIRESMWAVSDNGDSMSTIEILEHQRSARSALFVKSERYDHYTDKVKCLIQSKCRLKCSRMRSVYPHFVPLHSTKDIGAL